MEKQKKKRGRYKRYLVADSECCSDMPRRTKFRRDKKTITAAASHQRFDNADHNVHDGSDDDMVNADNYANNVDGNKVDDGSDDEIADADDGRDSDDEQNIWLLDEVADENYPVDHFPPLFASLTSEHEDEQPTEEISNGNNNYSDETFSWLEKHGKEPLYPGAMTSNLEAFLCTLSFIQRFKLSGVCVEALMKFLQIILPEGNNFPGSKYLLYSSLSSIPKNFNNKSYEIHYYCRACKNYLGKFPNEDECAVCEEKFSYNSSAEEGNFFLYMPLEDQLRVKFEKDNWSELVKNEKQRVKTGYTEGEYSSILDGDLYRQLGILDDPNVISVHWSTDGMPVFKSKGYSIWPIQCCLNELPFQEKKKQIILTGMWFGTEKPKMQECFLKPFVNEMNKLKSEGFQWKDKETGQTKIMKVVTTLCTADAPARAIIQNFNQYNGKFGCGFCLNEGKRIVRGRGHSRVYPHELPLPDQRTAAQTVQFAEKALEKNKTFMGVKGPSTLMLLQPEFNIINFFTPDYMHAALLGVWRHFMTMFVESTQVSAWHVDSTALDQRIESIKVTHEISREPRCVEDIKYFKASEWRTLLIFSPLLLHRLFKTASYYKHWLLFVYGLYSLLGSQVKHEDIINAEIALNKFVFSIKELYGEENQTYNAHILTHLPKAVVQWGPLWAQSAFMFEDNLGHLKMLHHGTKGIPQQIFKSYYHECLFQRYSQEIDTSNNIGAVKFIQDLRRGYLLTRKHSVDNSGVTAFGKHTRRNLTQQEVTALENAGIEHEIRGSFNIYKRITFNHNLYSTSTHCEDKQKVDSIISVADQIIDITDFIRINEKIIGFGYRLKVQSYIRKDDDIVENLTHYIQLVKKRKEIVAFFPESISSKYCTLQFEDDSEYILKLPNCIERS